MLTGTYALIIAAAFSGAAIYINFVEQPARLNLENSALLTEWKLAYKRGFVMQSTLALISGILGIMAHLQSNNYLWLTGAIIILSNWPYTLIVIRPIVMKLLVIDSNLANEATRKMIIKWGMLHTVRSMLAILAVVIFILASLKN